MYKKWAQYSFLAAGVWFFSGCGRIAYDLSAPKAIPAPAVQPEAVGSIALNTLLNILGNSLLELILVVIAIVLYMRYQGFKRQQKIDVFKHNEKAFVDFHNSPSAWHFNEEEKS